VSADSTELTDFGKRLAGMRRAYDDRIDLPNLRKSAFATLLGVSAIEYDGYERGDRAPTFRKHK
jgi:hypothetical protein